MAKTSKPVLVLVPGLSLDADLFAHQITHLGDCAEIIVADTLQDDSIGAMAQRILDTVDAPRFSLAGLSMGGYVAQEVMRRAKERVERLALLDTNARADTPEQCEVRETQIEAARSGKLEILIGFALKALTHPQHAADPLFAERVLTMMRRVGAEAFIRQQIAIKGRPDGRGDLADISCPVLCIVGREDAVTPPSVLEEIAHKVRRGTLVVIEDCGHLAPIEQPHAVTALLRYWLQQSE